MPLKIESSSAELILVKNGKKKWGKHKGKHHSRKLRHPRFWSRSIAAVRMRPGPVSQPSNELGEYRTPVPSPQIEPKIEPPLTARTPIAPQQMAPPQNPSRITCNQASGMIANYGFVDIRPTACSGSVYQFTATRDGKPFAIALNSKDGELAQVRKMAPPTKPEQPWD